MIRKRGGAKVVNLIKIFYNKIWMEISLQILVKRWNTNNSANWS